MLDIKLIKTFIKLSLPIAPLEEINRCINKASIIKYKKGMLFIADKETIFYFIIDTDKRRTKEFRRFYDDCYLHMKGRYFFSEDISTFKKTCQLIDPINPLNPNFKKYKWL